MRKYDNSLDRRPTSTDNKFFEIRRPKGSIPYPKVAALDSDIYPVTVHDEDLVGLHVW
jgi:hypothetical protein